MIENAKKQKQNVGNGWKRMSSYLGPPSRCFHSLFVIGFTPEKCVTDREDKKFANFTMEIQKRGAQSKTRLQL